MKLNPKLINYVLLLLGLIGFVFILVRNYLKNNVPIGWDTPHYIYSIDIISNEGIRDYIIFKKATYLFYPFLGYINKIITGLSSYSVEIYLPILLVIVSIIMSYLIFKKLFKSNFIAILVVPFMVGWTTIYSFISDLHPNNLVFCLFLVIIYFFFEFVESGKHKFLVIFLLIICSLTQFETTLFFTIIFSAFILTYFTINRISLKKGVLLCITMISLAILPWFISIMYSSKTLEFFTQGAKMYYIIPDIRESWISLLGGGFYVLFISIGLIFLVSKILSKPLKKEILFFSLWALFSLIIAVSSMIYPNLRAHATRSLILFPSPFIATIGLYEIIKIIKTKAKGIGKIIILFLLLSLTLTTLTLIALNISNNKLKPYIAEETFVDINSLSKNRQSGDYIFLVYAKDNEYSGEFLDLWKDWLYAFFGRKIYLYPSRIEDFKNVGLTKFNDPYLNLRVKEYITQINEANLLNCNKLKESNIILIKEFYKADDNLDDLIKLTNTTYLIKNESIC